MEHMYTSCMISSNYGKVYTHVPLKFSQYLNTLKKINPKCKVEHLYTSCIVCSIYYQIYTYVPFPIFPVFEYSVICKCRVNVEWNICIHLIVNRGNNVTCIHMFQIKLFKKCMKFVVEHLYTSYMIFSIYCKMYTVVPL